MIPAVRNFSIDLFSDAPFRQTFPQIMRNPMKCSTTETFHFATSIRRKRELGRVRQWGFHRRHFPNIQWRNHCLFGCVIRVPVGDVWQNERRSRVQLMSVRKTSQSAAWPPLKGFSRWDLPHGRGWMRLVRWSFVASACWPRFCAALV